MKPQLRSTLENLKFKVTALHSYTAHRGSLGGLDKVFEHALNQTDEQRKNISVSLSIPVLAAVVLLFERARLPEATRPQPESASLTPVGNVAK